MFDELLGAELIDQVRFTPSAEYAFRHPLIRAVAYESQLKSDRAQWHRRLAAAIQEREPGVGGGERGADRRTSGGRRRSARRVWLAHARRRVVDQPRSSPRPGSVGSGHAGSPTRCLPTTPTSCRCASPPAPCCVPPTCKPASVQESQGRFAELRELCSAAGDKVSLAIGMTRAGHRAHVRRARA